MAGKSDVVRARIEPELKDQAERIFHRLGLTHSQAILMFYRQVALSRGIPFEVRLPNAVTLAAVEEMESGRELPRYADVDALFDEIEAED